MLSSLQSLSTSTMKAANENSSAVCLPITERLLELLFSQTNNVIDGKNLQMRELLVEEYERCVHSFLSSSESASLFASELPCSSSSSSPHTDHSTHTLSYSQSVNTNENSYIATSKTFTPIKCIVESVNKAVIGNIRGFPGPMCSPFRRKHFQMLKSNDYFVTEKSDGLRVIAVMCRAHLFPNWMCTSANPLPIFLDNIDIIMNLERAAIKLAQCINNSVVSSEPEYIQHSHEEIVMIDQKEYVLSRYFATTELEHVNRQMLNENTQERYCFRAATSGESKEVATNIWLLVRSMQSQCLTFTHDRCMDATYMFLSTINPPLYEFAIFDCELLELFSEECSWSNKSLEHKVTQTELEKEGKDNNENTHQQAHAEHINAEQCNAASSRFALALFDLYAYREIAKGETHETNYADTPSSSVDSLFMSDIVYLTRKKMSYRYELLKKVAEELCVTTFKSSYKVLWYVKELLPLQELPLLLERITNDEKKPSEYWYHHYYHRHHHQDHHHHHEHEHLNFNGNTKEEEEINACIEEENINEEKTMLSIGKSQNDGFIFTPDDFPLVTGASKTQLKWKWREKLSIDWRVSRLSQDNNEYLLSLYFYKHNYNHREDTIGHWTLSLPAKLENPHNYFIPAQNEWVIAECVYDEEQSKWSIDKIRYDKREANSIVTAISIYESLVEHITLQTLLNNTSINYGTANEFHTSQTWKSSYKFAPLHKPNSKEFISQKKQQDTELECQHCNEEKETSEEEQQEKVEPCNEEQKEEFYSVKYLMKSVEPAKFILRAIRSNTGVIKCRLWWTTNESNLNYKNNIPCFHCELSECFGLLPCNTPLYGTPFSLLESYLLIRLANAGGSYAWSDFVVDAIFNGEVGAWEIVQCYDDACNIKRQTSFDYTLQHLEELMHKKEKKSELTVIHQYEQELKKTNRLDVNAEDNKVTCHSGINKATSINDIRMKTKYSHEVNPHIKKMYQTNYDISKPDHIYDVCQTEFCKVKMSSEAINFWKSYEESEFNVANRSQSNDEICSTKEITCNADDLWEDVVDCYTDCKNDEHVDSMNNNHVCKKNLIDICQRKCKKVIQIMESMQSIIVELGVKYLREEHEQKQQLLEEEEEEEEKEHEEEKKVINRKVEIQSKDSKDKSSNNNNYNKRNDDNNTIKKRSTNSKKKAGKFNHQQRSSKRKNFNKKHELWICAADINNYCRTYLAKWQSVQPTFVLVSNSSLPHLTVAAAEYCVTEGMSIKIPNNRKSKGFRAHFKCCNFFNSQVTELFFGAKLNCKSSMKLKTEFNVISCDTILARTIVSAHELDDNDNNINSNNNSIYTFVQNISSLLVQKGVFVGLFYDDITRIDSEAQQIEQNIFSKNIPSIQYETHEQEGNVRTENMKYKKESCENKTPLLPIVKEKSETVNVNNNCFVEHKPNDVCSDESWKAFQDICNRYNLRLAEHFQYEKMFDTKWMEQRCCAFKKFSPRGKRERDDDSEPNSNIANLKRINDNDVRSILQKFRAFIFVKEETNQEIEIRTHQHIMNDEECETEEEYEEEEEEHEELSISEYMQ